MKNKELEKKYFEEFRANYTLPNGELVYSDKPDVMIQDLASQKKIGIEITNFYLESGRSLNSEQVQNAIRKKVVAEAQRKYAALHKGDLHLTFTFSKDVPIRDQRALTDKILNFASQLEGAAPGPIANMDFASIPELTGIYLSRGHSSRSDWRSQLVYDGTIMSFEKLKAIVNSKEEQARGYTFCDELWLLVVIDFFDSAQDQEIASNQIEDVHSTKFQKIIVFKTIFGSYVCLG